MSASHGGLLNRAINTLPFELHIPGYQFCGPGTRLTKRLTRGDTGINPLDVACRKHDIAYSHSNDLTDRHAAHKVLVKKARKYITVSNLALSERAAAAAVWAAMKAKTKIGMDMKPKKKMTRKKATKKRILLMTKRSDALLFLPMLGALGSLILEAERLARQKRLTIAKPRDVSSKSCNVTSARWNRAADCISLRTNTDADCISARINTDRV